MPRITVRTAAVIAVAALSATASTGVAGAASKEKTVRTHVQHVVTTSSGQVQALSAHATGDGPATQADCDNYTTAIGSWQQAADEALLGDDHAGWTTATNNASALIDKAMDDGCFIIY